MLSNAYFLAKYRFDIAENEPAKNLQNFVNFPNFANPNPDLSVAGGWRAHDAVPAPRQHGAEVRTDGAVAGPIKDGHHPMFAFVEPASYQQCGQLGGTFRVGRAARTGRAVAGSAVRPAVFAGSGEPESEHWQTAP